MKRLLTALLLTAVPASAQAADKIHSETNFNELSGVVKALFGTLIIFLPAVATFYLALSGYRYIIAQGNPDLIEKAKKSLTYAVFGVIISYSAVAIIYLIATQFGIDTGFSI